MIEIGIIGLDTSHSEAYANIISDRGDTTVAAVWDSGDLRSESYTDSFCQVYNAERYENSRDIVNQVDAIMIETVNWNNHAKLAVPFLKTGVPTFIDKPIAGEVSDIEDIELAAVSGEAPVFGGSALPYHPDLSALSVEIPNRTLFCSGYEDSFFYGSHIVDTARYFGNTDWSQVTPLNGPGKIIEITFENGSNAVLQLNGPDENPTFGVLDVGDRVHASRLLEDEKNNRKMFERSFEGFVQTITSDESSLGRIVDSAILLLAVHAALETNDVITPESNFLCDISIDGDAYLDEYAQVWL